MLRGGNMRFRTAIFFWFVFTQSFFKFHKNGDIRRLKACSFRLWKNDFCRLYNKRAKALQIWITFFLIRSYLYIDIILHAGTSIYASSGFGPLGPKLCGGNYSFILSNIHIFIRNIPIVNIGVFLFQLVFWSFQTKLMRVYGTGCINPCKILGSPLIDGIFLVQKMCIYSCVTLSTTLLITRGPVQRAVSLWCINVYIMYIYFPKVGK